jgi:hypothetical protein
LPNTFVNTVFYFFINGSPPKAGIGEIVKCHIAKFFLAFCLIKEYGSKIFWFSTPPSPRLAKFFREKIGSHLKIVRGASRGSVTPLGAIYLYKLILRRLQTRRLRWGCIQRNCVAPERSCKIFLQRKYCRFLENRRFSSFWWLIPHSFKRI